MFLFRRMRSVVTQGKTQMTEKTVYASALTLEAPACRLKSLYRRLKHDVHESRSGSGSERSVTLDAEPATRGAGLSPHALRGGVSSTVDCSYPAVHCPLSLVWRSHHFLQRIYYNTNTIRGSCCCCRIELKRSVVARGHNRGMLKKR